MQKDRGRINFIWLFTVLAYGIFHAYVAPEKWGSQAISDSGIISYLTVLLAVLSGGMILKSAFREKNIPIRFALYATSYIIAIYILREADVHRLFTDVHVTKLKFYRHENISLTQKILWGVPMSLFIACFFYLTIRYCSHALKGLLAMKPWAIAFFLWGILILVSQLIDKTELNDIYRGRVLEEIMELAAAGFMLIAAWLITNEIEES
jgi:hypothetical protein